MQAESAASTTRLDVAHPRAFTDAQGQPQTRWTTIGAAFVGRNREGEATLSAVVHYVPTATDRGSIRLQILPVRGRDDEAGELPDGLPERFRVLHPRRFRTGDGDESATDWQQVGVAFRNRAASITVLLHQVPTQRDEGAIRVVLKDRATDDAAVDEDHDAPAEEGRGASPTA